MSITRNRILIGLILFLLLFSLLPTYIVSALVWNPGVTFNCENQYYSTTIPLTVTNISVDIHWVSVNGIGFNITFGGTSLWNNISSITTYPKTDTGWIINWTQQKTAWAATSDYSINGLKATYDYILYSNGSGTTHTTDASGVLTFSSAITSTNRNYAIYDAGIPAGLFVSTTGSDTTGTGTLANPYKTLQRAVNASTTSDDIYMRGGLYIPSQKTVVNRSGTAGDWYTIQNYAGENVFIDGANVAHGDCSINATIQILGNQDYIRITGITFNHSTNGGISESYSGGECSYIRVDNCSFLDNGGWAFKANRGSYIWFDDNIVTNNFCNWHGIPGASLSQETISYSHVEYGRVHGNTLWKNHCENIDIKYGSSNCTITNNIINTTGHGPTLKGAITYNGGIGVYIDCIGASEDTMLIDSNYIYGNNTAVQVNNEGAAGHYSNIQVSNNIIHINQTGNAHPSTGRIGIVFCVDGAAPDNNHDLVVMYNTIYMDYTDAGHTWGAVQTQTTRFTGITIANNILALNIPSADAYYCIFPGITLASGIIHQYHNVYEDFYAGSAPHISWNSISYHESDTAYFQDGYLFSNPLFHDRRGGDYNINITSPCIDTTDPAYTISLDYDGTSRPQDAGYDRGAYEYIGTFTPSFVFSAESPTNTSIDSPLTPTLSIHIAETHGYMFNYTMKENTTGAWLDLTTGNDQTDGTFTHVYHTAIAYSTKYWWKITAVNGTTWHNETYYFTTLAPATPSFTFSGISPVNTSTGVALTPNLDFTINEAHGYGYSALLQKNSSGIWTDIWGYYGGDLANGTYSFPHTTATSYSHKYWWRLTAWSGTTYHVETYYFTTLAAPIFDIALDSIYANWTTSTSINITWTKTADCTNTIINRSEIGYLNGDSNIYAGTNTWFNDTLRNPTIRYYYTLTPYNSVSTSYGTPMNVSLAETDNTSYLHTGASWIDFQGWMATDKPIQTRYNYATNPVFTYTVTNETLLETDYSSASIVETDLYGLTQRGQRFHIYTDQYYIFNVTIKARRSGSPGMLYCNLYTVGADKLPTGPVIATGSVNANSFTTSSSGAWYNITMSATYLTGPANFSFVISIPGGTSGNKIEIKLDNVGTYPDGQWFASYDGGATYHNYSSEDGFFKIWGKEPTTTFSYLSTTNTTRSTSDVFDILQNSLNSGRLYYYRTAANDTKGNMTRGNTRFSLTNPGVPTFLYMIPIFTNNSLNLTWSMGIGANRTLIVNGGTHYPTSPSDGTILYNGTGTQAWLTGILSNSTVKLSLFSYTTWAGLCRFSSPATIPWGGCTFIVRNESRPWQVINATILVTDNQGHNPVQFTNVYGYYSFNISQIPYGSNTHFYITNSSYRSRLYVYDLSVDVFYNLTFYLPPIHQPGWNTTHNYSANSYMIQVITTLSGESYEQQLTVPGARVEFYKYMNYTDNYTYIGGFVTDGNGQGSIDLFPYELYMIKIICTGYDNKTDFWTPNIVEQGLIKVFKIVVADVVIPPTEYTDFWTTVVFTAIMDDTNTTRIHYYDASGHTTDTQLYLYEFYNGTTTFVASDTKIGDNNFYWNTSLLNYTRTYIVVLRFNSTNDFQIPDNKVVITVYPLKPWPTHSFDLEKRITDIFGDFKINGVIFTWIGFFLSLAPLIILTLFDPAHVGIGIIATGFFMGGIQAVLASWTTNAPPPLIIIVIPVVIVIGILYMLAQRNGWL